MDISITDQAIKGFKELDTDVYKDGDLVRILLNPDGEWEFLIEYDEKWNDTTVVLGNINFILDPVALESAQGASIDYNDDEGFIFRGGSPKVHVCTHLKDLPPTPSLEELNSLRIGLRKQKIPDMKDYCEGRHPDIGRFLIEHSSNAVQIEWNILGNPTKKFSLDDLCFDTNRELDRLEFGWMVANMALLDKMHAEKRTRDIPDPMYAMKEMTRVTNYFEKIENRWRHWALVPAGHMLVNSAPPKK